MTRDYCNEFADAEQRYVCRFKAGHDGPHHPHINRASSIHAALPSDSEEAAGPTHWPQHWPVPTDAELAERADEIVSAMCAGDKWRMSIPVQPSDSDIVLSELVRRFRLRSSPSVPESAATLREAAQQVVDGARHARFCAVYDPSGASACDCGLAALRAALSGLVYP